MALIDLLSRGYFPKELPNPFVTSTYASVLTSQAAALPGAFGYSWAQDERLLRKLSGKPVKYTHARGGILRRTLHLPNPILNYLLTREIDSNWATLGPHIGGTTLSATSPVFSPTGRAVQGKHSHDGRTELAVQTRLGNKYILKTDITRFYPSVYTHSIPWAIHTKSVAKADRGMGLLGNRLDLLARNSQDGQTVGIPIGPDTSLVIAEILMQKCDAELIATFPGIRGHRFVDDYELGFRHRSDAEAAFHHLERILAGYELVLNSRKTYIAALPCGLEAPWVGPLRSFEFQTTSRGQRFDLLRYFDLAFELNKQYPDESVLQFAISRLSSVKVDASNWETFQHLLLGCVIPEPAPLPYVLASIIERVKGGAVPALSGIERVMNALIIDHAGLAHSSEVAWALWACLALSITISSEAVTAVSTCKDSVIALLALHCEAEGLVSAPLDHTTWSNYMTSDELYDEHWLLAYEANIKGWLPSLGGGDHVSADPNFGFLKASGVSFYDVTKAVPAAPNALPPTPILPTPPRQLDASAL